MWSVRWARLQVHPTPPAPPCEGGENLAAEPLGLLFVVASTCLRSHCTLPVAEFARIPIVDCTCRSSGELRFTASIRESGLIMSHSAVSASGAPYVLELNDLGDPKFDNPEKPVFSVATPAGERFDAAWLEQVPPEGEIDWLWPGMIPLRKVTLIEGPAGAGKSQLALDLAARVTRSAPWPDGQPSLLPTADVLVVCRKDEAAAASARFERAGGDRAKLFHFCEFQTFLPASGTKETRPIAFPYDFPALEHHIEVHESFGVIVIDSLADFCKTPGQVAETLVLLEDLASRANVALVVTLPANCRIDAQGRLRVTSRWPTDRVRSAWCVLPDADDPRRRLFVARRTNFCREPDGLAYRLSDRGVAWESSSNISPVDPLGQFRASDVCLAELLGDGELPASTVFRMGAELGFSPKQLRAAGARLKVSSTRIGFSGKGHWSWSLPGARTDGGDDAERGNENTEPVCLTSIGVGRSETLDGTRSVPTTSGECMGMFGESMGNRALAAAPGDDHVEQVSNLLVSPPASPAGPAVQQKSEPRMARIDTNDEPGEQEAGDDAERGNERAEPASAPSIGVERTETLDGTQDQPAGRCPPATLGECMGIIGESMANNGQVGNLPHGTSRRRRRRTKRNRKKELRRLREGVA
jgi:hypothetical protein